MEAEDDLQSPRPERHQPLNPVPPVVWALVLPMIALELLLTAGDHGLVGGPQAIGWRSQAVQIMAYSPDFMRAMLAEHQYPADGMRRLVSYPFVHLSVSHILFTAAILLALGKFVGEAFRWWGVLAVFFVTAVVGALVYTWALPWIRTPLVGAWVPIYGLIGAFSFILWHRLRNEGPKRWRAFSMIGSLMLFKLLFSPLFGWGWDAVAELPAFATGFLLSYAVSPGGARRLLRQIRQGGVTGGN